MTVPTTRPISITILNVIDRLVTAKNSADAAVITLAAGAVNSDYVFRLLDDLRTLISQIAAWKLVANLDAQAQAMIPGYAGSLTSDLTASATAAQTCIDWVVGAFPSAGGFIQAYSLSADGSRTPRAFPSAATAQLRTNLQALSATIGP